MTETRSQIFAAAVALGCLLMAIPASAAPCPGFGSFDNWLSAFRQEAASAGVGPRGLAALNGISPDPAVVSRDRGQGVFHQTFEQFSSRMVNSYRLSRGASLIRQYGDTFNRIERQFGVPASVIVAIWGLETDFGAGNGNFPTIRSLATLAYDCRRAEMFRAELIDALKLVDRGDLTPGEMRGAWAGEIGQTQFMPSSYIKFAVDYGGGRNLIRSVPDVLASTANYLKSYGWQRGEPWGPGTGNFAVIKQWNKADVYARTIAYFADRLAAMTGQGRAEN
ncbi:MAG: lytic murein transglycosylase [Hyphomicrobiales bacterium]|nr:lytic murein transglycosylase [Hyphomicrobiales bacterium]